MEDFYWIVDAMLTGAFLSGELFGSFVGGIDGEVPRAVLFAADVFPAFCGV